MKNLCVVAVAFGLVLAGCGATRRAASSRAPESLPAASELEAQLQARRQALHSMRALARLRYSDPHDSNTSREAIVVARPDRLRVEVLSFFGAMFVLAATEGQMTAYSRRENTVYRGAASSENMWHYARIGMPVRDLVDIILGTPPASNAGSTTVSYDPARSAVRLTRDLEDGALAVWFDGNVPIAAEHGDAWGEILWQARFSDYEDQEGIPVATRIRLEVPAWDRAVDIELTDIDVNPVLDETVFELPTPAGAKVVTLDAS
jgi:outer membrane lipoprotein-sorting protein